MSFGEFASVVNESIGRRVATRFRQLDRNNDGLCTRAEVNKMGVERFTRFDTNHDGKVTPDEFRRFYEIGMELGFRHVESGPLVRSSYHAWEQVQAAGV